MNYFSFISVCLEAPYKVEEAGSAPIDVIIDVHLKCSMKPEVFRIKYGTLFEQPKHSSANTKCFCCDIRNRSSQIEKKFPKRNDCMKGKKLSTRAPHIPSISFSTVYHQLNKKHRKVILEESGKPANITRRTCHRCLTRVTPCPSCQPRRIPHPPILEVTTDWPRVTWVPSRRLLYWYDLVDCHFYTYYFLFLAFMIIIYRVILVSQLSESIRLDVGHTNEPRR